MTYVVTATHPFFDQPLVLERGAPFTPSTARAWVNITLLQLFPDVEWMDEQDELFIGINDEVAVPASSIQR